MTPELTRTVAARTIELAEVLGLELFDGHRAGAVVLKDLVVRVTRAAAADLHGLRGRAALQRGRVLADVLPPDVLERAAAVAVDAVGGWRAEDHVLERGTVGEVEQRPLV